MIVGRLARFALPLVPYLQNGYYLHILQTWLEISFIYMCKVPWNNNWTAGTSLLIGMVCSWQVWEGGSICSSAYFKTSLLFDILPAGALPQMEMIMPWSANWRLLLSCSFPKMPCSFSTAGMLQSRLIISSLGKSYGHSPPHALVSPPLWHLRTGSLPYPLSS